MKNRKFSFACQLYNIKNTFFNKLDYFTMISNKQKSFFKYF